MKFAPNFSKPTSQRIQQSLPTDEPRHPDLASGQSWPPKGL